MRLIAELKRRNVFRVALFYIVAAWVIIQVAETLLPVFDVPDAAIRVIVLILALGFPLALVFSWVFEMTPEGLKRETDVEVSPATKQQTTNKLNWATLIAALLAIGLMVVDRMIPEPAPALARTAIAENASNPTGPPKAPVEMTEDPEPGSIAVLPFEDLSPSGDQQYFSDGIAEEILNVLAGVDGLKVASRTSSFQFKGQRAIGIPQIAEHLEVRNVLEGSVRTAGNQIRVTAQLIDASADEHLWSETFDRELSIENVFAIQDEISRAIVESIRDRLGAELGSPTSASIITESLDAYALYLRARRLFRARSDFREIDLLLSRAIELDPEFDDALALRAATLMIAPEYGVMLYGDWRTSSQMGLDLAERALSINPENALAIGVIGQREDYLLYRDEGDAVTLSEVFQRHDQALALAPDNLNLLNWRGHLYMRAGDFQAAERDFAHCLEIEPTMVPCRNNRVAAILLDGRRAEADVAFSEALRYGTIGADMSTLMMVHQLGREDAFYMQALRQPPLRGWLDMGELYRALQDPGEDHAVLRQRLLAHAEALGTEYALADILIALGDYDRVSTTYAFWFAPFAGYRRSDGFRRFVDQLGLLEYWHENGFPKQCRPVGGDNREEGFECD